MANSPKMTSLVFVYLLLSMEPIQAFRTKRNKDQMSETDQHSQEADAEAKEDAEWCNPFGGRRTKRYRIEVLESGDNCSVGVCTAYEFVRDPERPVLKVHHGQSWAVTAHYDESTETTSLVWSLEKSNVAERSWDEEHDIYNASLVTYGAPNPDRGLREYVHFTWADASTTNISGGVYYQEGLMLRGFEELAEEQGSAHGAEIEHVHAEGSEVVRDDNIITHSAKKVAPYGVAVGAVAVGGYKIAATFLLGITIKNTALVKAAFIGTLGGGAIFAVAGAAIGSIIGIMGIVGLVGLIREQGLSGADKYWDKLWCMDFKTCVKNREDYHGDDNHVVTTMVRDGKTCPPDDDASWFR